MPEFEVFKGNTKKLLKKFKTNNIFIELLFFIMIVFIICLIIFFVIYNKIESSDVIQNGVFIKSINVSGLTRDEAIEKVSSNLDTILNNHIELVYKGNIYYLEIEQINAVYDVESSVDLALNIAKNGDMMQNMKEYINVSMGNINIDPIFSYNEEALTSYIKNVEIYLPDQLEQADYYIEDDELIVVNGVNGAGIKYEQLSNSIIDAIQNNTFTEKYVSIPTYTIYPDPIDVDKIHDEVYTEMQNAYFTTDPYAVFADVTGVDFNVDDLKNDISNEPKATEYKIALNYTYPEVTVNDFGREAFPNLLASFSTEYVNNPNRTTNLKLAANKIDGKVVMPGDIFSYNRTVGKRTSSAGYKNAAIYQDGEVVDGIGGGICQISSTLYNAAIAADMEIEQRRNHMFVPSYVKAGRDATVVWGAQDFQFKNRRNYPVKIEADVSGGVATVNIYGLRTEDDYDKIYIKTETIKNSDNSLVVDSYRVFEKNGEVVKTTKLYRDTYKKHS